MFRSKPFRFGIVFWGRSRFGAPHKGLRTGRSGSKREHRWVSAGQTHGLTPRGDEESGCVSAAGSGRCAGSRLGSPARTVNSFRSHARILSTCLRARRREALAAAAAAAPAPFTLSTFSGFYVRAAWACGGKRRVAGGFSRRGAAHWCDHCRSAIRGAFSRNTEAVFFVGGCGKDPASRGRWRILATPPHGVRRGGWPLPVHCSPFSVAVQPNS